MKTASLSGICHMQTANDIKDYLRGINRTDSRALESLKKFDHADWQQMALVELTNRMTSVVRVMSDKELMLVACGEVQLPNLIQQVCEEAL